MTEGTSQTTDAQGSQHPKIASHTDLEAFYNHIDQVQGRLKCEEKLSYQEQIELLAYELGVRRTRKEQGYGHQREAG